MDTDRPEQVGPSTNPKAYFDITTEELAASAAAAPTKSAQPELDGESEMEQIATREQRRYSAGLYNFTKSLWEQSKMDIERKRSNSVSSGSSGSTSTSVESTLSPIEARRVAGV